MDSKNINKLFLLSLAAIILSLWVLPSFKESFAQKKYHSLKNETLFQIHTTESEWYDSDTNTVEFTLDNFYMLNHYEISMNLRYSMNASPGRITILTYSIYSNSVYVDTIKHSINARDLSGFSTYSPIIIPVETLKEGINEVSVEISVRSKTSETLNTTERCDLNVVDMQVKTIPKILLFFN